MRSIDRIELLEEIGRPLQSRMTFADIDVFFSGFDIDCRGASSGRGSKRLYVKEILANTSDDKILQIVDELGIPHTYHSQLIADEGRFWDVGHFRFRLFLSHVAAFKDKAAYLEKRLRDFGISAFVAHQDIEPTKEWLVEIEKALFSMDALAALLTPGFADSHWTDHEVGVAIGRSKLVIPILKGQIPYGFISKCQGLQGEGKSVSQVANAIFEVLVNHLTTRDSMLGRLVDLILRATNEEQAVHRVSLLCGVPQIPRKHLEALQANAGHQEIFRVSQTLRARINELLGKHRMGPLAIFSETSLGDDAPF